MRSGARLTLTVLSVILAACGTAESTRSTKSSVPAAEHPSISIPPTAGPTPVTERSPALNGMGLAAPVNAEALHAHLETLQRITTAGGGSRATGTVAFDESVRYVSGQLTGAGYRVQHHVFEVAGVATTNVIVERRGTADGVLMLGAHLDSVAAGPGINDNGSGVAALLVIAEHLGELRPALTVRLAFWGAEEGGPFGSAAYVDSLAPEERHRITAYLNFDMLASPNAVRFVYDEAGAAPASEVLTDVFAAAFDEAGLAWEPIDLEGDSDHGPFIDAGIPTGGLFSGGIEPVTDAQAATFGAVAGQPADPCSHRACDTIENVDLATLHEMTDAIAHVLVKLAFDGD